VTERDETYWKRRVEQQLEEVIAADPEMFEIDDTPEARQRAKDLGVRVDEE